MLAQLSSELVVERRGKGRLLVVAWRSKGRLVAVLKDNCGTEQWKVQRLGLHMRLQGERIWWMGPWRRGEGVFSGAYSATSPIGCLTDDDSPSVGEI